MGTLKLDGKDFLLQQIPPAIQKLRNFLLTQPADELFSNLEMEKRGFSERTLDRAPKFLDDVTRSHQKRRYWGNPEAIKELDRRLA